MNMCCEIHAYGANGAVLVMRNGMVQHRRTRRDTEGTEGDRGRPKETEGDRRRPMETEGDRRIPKETEGDRRRPKETEGNRRRPQETEGDRRRPKETERDRRAHSFCGIGKLLKHVFPLRFAEHN